MVKIADDKKTAVPAKFFHSAAKNCRVGSGLNELIYRKIKKCFKSEIRLICFPHVM